MIVCKVCHGISKTRCYICSKTSIEWRKFLIESATKKGHVAAKLADKIIDHNLYLKATWDKLKKYQAWTTQNIELDEQLRDMFGYWLKQDIVEVTTVQIVRYYLQHKDRPMPLGHIDAKTLLQIGLRLRERRLLFLFTNTHVFVTGVDETVPKTFAFPKRD